LHLTNLFSRQVETYLRSRPRLDNILGASILRFNLKLHDQLIIRTNILYIF